MKTVQRLTQLHPTLNRQIGRASFLLFFLIPIFGFSQNSFLYHSSKVEYTSEEYQAELFEEIAE